MPGKQHFFAIFPRKLLSFINARPAWEMAYSHAQHATFLQWKKHGNKLASCHESWFFSSCRMHSKASVFSCPRASPTAAKAHHEAAQRPGTGRHGYSSQASESRTQLHPLKAASRALKFVAALAKLRFRAFPSKCYTKYLMES